MAERRLNQRRTAIPGIVTAAAPICALCRASPGTDGEGRAHHCGVLLSGRFAHGQADAERQSV